MEYPNDFEPSPEATAIKLDQFEGPLDLLLHLIRTNEVNIYDIPLALITTQYLATIELMQELNLDVAGEFLVMASTLIHIKSRMLLPRPDPTQDDQVEEDPREALVRRLLEHQKYKAAAELLHERETLRSAQFMRPDARVADAAGEEYEPELEVDLFSLLAAFKGVLERASRRPPMVLPPDEIPIETRIEQLLQRLSETEACGFEDLKTRYRAGKVGDVEVKTKLAAAINAVLEPMRERRRAVMSRPERIREIAVEGSRKARGIAQQTMERVRDAVRLRY